jgi:hypothetical protein
MYKSKSVVRNFYLLVQKSYLPMQNFYSAVQNFYLPVQDFYTLVQNFYTVVQNFYTLVQDFYLAVQNFYSPVQNCGLLSQFFRHRNQLISKPYNALPDKRLAVKDDLLNIFAVFLEIFGRIHPANLAVRRPNH